MTDNLEHRADEIPEADLAEQQTPVLPGDDDGEGTPTPSVPIEADSSDAWEQALPVAGTDDDGYDHPGQDG